MTITGHWLSHRSDHNWALVVTQGILCPVSTLCAFLCLDQVSPLAEGHVKVVLRDLCLEVSREVSANIYIAVIYSIQVQVPDKVCTNWLEGFEYCLHFYL